MRAFDFSVSGTSDFNGKYGRVQISQYFCLLFVVYLFVSSSKSLKMFFTPLQNFLLKLCEINFHLVLRLFSVIVLILCFAFMYDMTSIFQNLLASGLFLAILPYISTRLESITPANEVRHGGRNSRRRSLLQCGIMLSELVEPSYTRH